MSEAVFANQWSVDSFVSRKVNTEKAVSFLNVIPRTFMEAVQGGKPRKSEYLSVNTDVYL